MASPHSLRRFPAARRLVEHAHQLAPLDRLVAVYASCSAVILTTRVVAHVPWLGSRQPGWLLLAHVLLLALVCLAAVARRRAAPRLSVLAEWYPMVVLSAIYVSIGLTNGPRQDLGLSYDLVLLRWEGLVPAWVSLERWGGQPVPVVVQWWLGLAYLAFFPMVIASPLVLWLRGEFGHARRAIFGITLVYLLCYLLFLVFPVAGPAYSLGWPAAQSGADLPVRMVRALNDQGDSWGSAFPSSHVAASVMALLLAMMACRWLGTALVPITLGILLAVVHFRVHYVLDAAAGLLMAAAAAWLVARHWPIDPLVAEAGVEA